MRWTSSSISPIFSLQGDHFFCSYSVRLGSCPVQTLFSVENARTISSFSPNLLCVFWHRVIGQELGTSALSKELLTEQQANMLAWSQIQTDKQLINIDVLFQQAGGSLFNEVRFTGLLRRSKQHLPKSRHTRTPLITA